MKKEDKDSENKDNYSQELRDKAIIIYNRRVMIFRKIFISVLVIVYTVYFIDYLLEGGKEIFGTLAILSAILFASIVIIIFSEPAPTKKQIDSICRQLKKDREEENNDSSK